jgi:penicillin-binding protein 1A
MLPPLERGEERNAIVHELGPTWAVLQVGSRPAVLGLQGWTWCHNVNPQRDFRGFQCKSLDDMLQVGDVVRVRVEEARTWEDTLPPGHALARARLAGVSMLQEPKPDAAVLLMRTSDGAVLAMVGGRAFADSEFNRAVQARRQVGSTFKPFVYAAAMDHPTLRYGPGSLVLDEPLVSSVAGPDGKLWTPRNASGDYLGQTTLRQSLVLSRNLVTVRICEEIGSRWVLRYSRRFGFDPSELERGSASCLGTSALTVTEMVEAYSVFATLGARVTPRFLTEVRNRRGELVERPEPTIRPDILSRETAWMMADMLKDVVQQGTARRARTLGVPVAGKTGTTNDYRDAWFVGFTPELVAGVWLGTDEFETLGRGQYGGEVALPIWIDTMRPALEAYPPGTQERPPGLSVDAYETRDGWLVTLSLGVDAAREDVDAPLIEERLYRASDGIEVRSPRGRLASE